MGKLLFIGKSKIKELTKVITTEDVLRVKKYIFGNFWP